MGRPGRSCHCTGDEMNDDIKDEVIVIFIVAIIYLLVAIGMA